jgi:heme/copper-type cytochrome/quinol oxidase subunit 2
MRALAILFFVCFSRTAMACSTCFGDPDAPQTHAMNMAILFMLGVVGAMLGLFAAFFLHLRNRARHAARANLVSQFEGHS